LGKGFTIVSVTSPVCQLGCCGFGFVLTSTRLAPGATAPVCRLGLGGSGGIAFLL
jgi:hypothetical protein